MEMLGWFVLGFFPPPVESKNEGIFYSVEW